LGAGKLGDEQQYAAASGGRRGVKKFFGVGRGQMVVIATIGAG